MKEFPDILNITNRENFPKINKNRLKCYLRRDIYEHMLKNYNNEQNYFSLDDFNKRIEDMNLTQELVNDIIPELENLGWKCKLSFGNTGLFIYSTELPPPNCY